MNVWLAISNDRHVHHAAAKAWFDAVPLEERISFCRVTQLGLLRSLSTRAIMGEEVCTQRQCWEIFDAFLNDSRVQFLPDDGRISIALRKHSFSTEISPKRWSDDVLLAFAEVHGVTIVTFDKALARRSPLVTLLQG